ncbi:MAG: hypothetical protein QOJ53_1431 [Sphingomonadales bacterium]|jgi:hypothetical protein|nr:hypothetical protein [Sphingomonadales bacterium]MEA3047099.1 hypothetical protein [Sphingomonadales bacterium]
MPLLRAVLASSLANCFILGAALAQIGPLALSARIVDNRDAPIPSATLTCYGDGDRITPSPLPADLRGAVRSQIAFAGTHVRCRASAPGYDAVERTVLAADRRLDVGTMRLERTASLVLGPLLAVRTPNGSHTILEAFAENQSNHAWQVRQVEIAGSARIATSCLDARPAIIFNISDRVPISVGGTADLPVDTTLSTGWNEQILATGTVTRLGCDQVRISIVIPYLFVLNAGERQKLRIAVPTSLRQSGQNHRQMLDLSAWEALRLSLVGPGESRADTGLR